MSKYAFIDVDQTIYDGYSMADFYLGMVGQGYGGDWTIQRDKELGELYQAGKITYTEAGLRANQLTADVVKGLDIETVASHAANIVELKGLKPFAIELFPYLHSLSYQCILVSGSVEPIVSAISSYIKADGFFASELEVVDGHYTGKVVQVCDHTVKTAKIKHIISQNKPSPIIVFGDSTGDIPMLELSDHGFVVSPHQPELLSVIAKHPNWQVVNDQNLIQTVKNTLH